MFKPYASRISTLFATAAAVLLSVPAHALELNLPDAPLFLSPSVPPLNMLVIGRDHKLYYEAYNDYTDLDGDGTLDLRFKPSIAYYGYFDSAKCYLYDSGAKRFNPTRLAGAGNTCTAVSEEWSGNFLNYLTTARIDALRKVLYGGRRSVDTATTTVLERTHLPQDAHSWGKEYSSASVDGYDITQYSSLSLPSSDTRHLFANTTELNGNGEPLLRILESRTERIWNWVSIERPVAGREVLQTDGSRLDVTPTDYSVRVAVCVDNLREDNCKAYGNNYKPIGLLQEFGENDSMYFGLITGSYQKNTSGGVLRRRMDSIRDEINTDGTFKTAAADAGIIATLNRMRVTGFGGNYQYKCGFDAAARTIDEGECQMWGNPIAEMMYEGLRYFAGQGAPTSDYRIAFGAGEESELAGGGLPVERDWSNPYRIGTETDTDKYPYCAKPFQTVVSDINPSYDTDQLPGTGFGSFGGDTLGGMNVSALGQTIWNTEVGGTQSIFIGDVNGLTDGAPTPKNVSSFGNIRGLSPEEPTKRGGYYAASVAYHGRVTDISAAKDDQNVQTFSVALASPLPKIEIKVSETKKVTLVPFAKSVRGSGITPDDGAFQPTDQIVDFYVETLTDKSGTFRVNFEDVEQGADHDMDAIVVYDYTVNDDGTVTVKLKSEYAFGGITQHMGYVISGTTRDGVYLEVLDKRDGDVAGDVDYRLDTPKEFTSTPPAPTGTGLPRADGRWNDGQALPYETSRTFTAGSSSGATLLKDPLWYAAKWGGFKDSDGDKKPDLQEEWDLDRTGAGANVPDNYFLVTNALKLSEQLRQAFQDILAQSGAAAAASVNSGSITTTTRVYRAKFDSSTWTGELSSFAFDDKGKLRQTSAWDASKKLPAFGTRQIFTVNTSAPAGGKPAVPFRWESLDDTRKGQLSSVEKEQKDFIDYLRGNDKLEGATGLRPRGTSKIGDIISSAPLYVGAPRSRYQDIMPEGASYREYARKYRNRRDLVYVGANDGMLHAFDAGGAVGGVTSDEDTDGGREVFAFIPKTVFRNLKELPKRTYKHRYYVDGSPNSNDVYFGGDWRTVLVGGLNQGGQGIYALDITDPAKLASAEANNQSIYLWEFTDANDEDLGFTYSQPAIVRLQNGVWAAVFGNGYNNTAPDANPSKTGNAVLYVVNIETGGIIRKFDTGVGKSAEGANDKPNGMATPVMVDTDGDRVIDHAYAGDLMGNLWKFDLRSSNDKEWDFAFKDGNVPKPLFQATSTAGNVPQPITVRPEVTRGPFGAGVMVLFGTGKFLESTDTTVPTGTRVAQSLYGLLDNNTFTSSDRIVDRKTLTVQSITAETGGTRPTRTTTNNKLMGRGFYLDLAFGTNDTSYKGERSVTDPLIRGDRVIFTTLIPNSQACTFGGGSWLMVLDLLSGSRLPEMPLDRDGDGDIDKDDVGPDANGDGIPDRDPISGVGTNDEIWWRPEGVLCLSDDCENDQLLTPGSSGTLSDEQLRSVRGLYGRQSWRQLK